MKRALELGPDDQRRFYREKFAELAVWKRLVVVTTPIRTVDRAIAATRQLVARIGRPIRYLDSERGNHHTDTPLPDATIKVGTDRIRPARSWRSLGLVEVCRSGELIAFLTWRDLIVRYKQAVFGVAWAVIQPLTIMVIFTIIFGRVAKLPSEGLPYPAFAYAAPLPWQLFSSSVQRSGTSLVANAPMITKIYFPRLSIPLAAVGAGISNNGT